MARMALNRGAGSGGDGGGGALYASLSVERKKLSAQAEFRKRLGSGTGHGSGADSYESSVRGRGKHKLRAAVSEVFVDVDPRWPPPPSRNAGGIGMVIADGTSQKFDSSCTYFSFVFSDKYELDQVQYENLAALHDPNSIAQFSHAHARMHNKRRRIPTHELSCCRQAACRSQILCSSGSVVPIVQWV